MTEAVETAKLTQLGRTAEVRASTIDEEARTVEVTWTTGASVPRYMPGLGRVMEKLEVSDAAVRLDRLNNGAPFLNTHSDWSLRDVIGVVERAWIDGEEGRALIRFSEREEVNDIWNDVRTGILRNISVGYRVHRYEVIEGEGETCTRVIARDWEPREISAVPIGADDLAGFRSADDENPCQFMRATPASSSNRKEDPMTEQDITEGVAADGVPEERSAPAAQSVIDTAALQNEARQAERQRIADITDAGRKLGIEDSIVRAQIDAGVTADAARAAFIDAMADKDETGGEVRGRVSVGRDEQDTQRAMLSNAIEVRLDPRVQLEDGAREYRGMGLLEMGRTVLRQRGESVAGLSRSELAGKMLARGFHSTSDFPLILANVANKRLRDAYEAAPQTFRPIVNQTTLPDFKTVSRVQLSDAPSFIRKREGAEYKFGTMGENREQYALATYGRGLTFTREMIINDDLSAFDRIVRQFGTSAANLESDLVWGLVTGNANMSDSTAVFHADHSNLATPGAITIDNLGAAKALMRKQKSLAPDADTDGSILNLEPAFLAVPAELETVALQYTRQTSIVTDPANQNVHAGSMQPIIEPRLASLAGGSADDWYLFASPAQVDTIEFAYLEGEQGPQLEQMEDFDTDGIKLKGRLDVGAAWIDYRGAVKNAGS